MLPLSMVYIVNWSKTLDLLSFNTCTKGFARCFHSQIENLYPTHALVSLPLNR